MSRSGRILYLGAIALLFVTACAQSQSNQSSTSPIVIGLDLAKTGISAAYDVQPARGAQLAIKQINDSGGVLGRKLQFNWEDTKGDPAQGGTNATSLIANHAAALLVSCDLDLGGPAAVRGNASRVPTFSCAADPHFGDTKTLGPYAFQMNATTNNAGAVMAEWADSKGWRSTYVLGDTALQYSKSLGAYFTTRFKEQGGQVVGTDTWNYFKDTQFGAQVTRYLALPTKPDFIFMPGGVPTLASLVRQFRAAGINTPILCADACDGQVLTQTAGPISDLYFDTVACVPSYCNSNPANAKLVKFVADFTTMWSEAPATAYAVIGYDTIQVIAAAMKAANSTDGKAMLDQLNKLSVDGLGGKYTFTSTTHYPVNKPESIIQVQNGTFSLVSIYTPKSVPAP